MEFGIWNVAWLSRILSFILFSICICFLYLIVYLCWQPQVEKKATARLYFVKSVENCKQNNWHTVMKHIQYTASRDEAACANIKTILFVYALYSIYMECNQKWNRRMVKSPHIHPSIYWRTFDGWMDRWMMENRFTIHSSTHASIHPFIHQKSANGWMDGCADFWR